jgi:hypothetical protein
MGDPASWENSYRFVLVVWRIIKNIRQQILCREQSPLCRLENHDRKVMGNRYRPVKLQDELFVFLIAADNLNPRRSMYTIDSRKLLRCGRVMHHTPEASNAPEQLRGSHSPSFLRSSILGWSSTRLDECGTIDRCAGPTACQVGTAEGEKGPRSRSEIYPGGIADEEKNCAHKIPRSE